MKTFPSILSSSILLVICCSCHRTPGLHRNPGPDISERDISLLPGECLVSNDLTCTYCNQSNYAKTYLFEFAIDLDIQAEQVGTNTVFKQVRHLPSDKVFQRFGSDEAQVREDYYNVCRELTHTQTTFFYDKEDIVLTADAEFAGIPAGENIASLFMDSTYPLENWPTGKSYPIPSYIEPFMIGQDNMLLMISPGYRIQYGPDNNMDDYMNDEGVIIPMDKQALLGFKIYVLNKYKFVRKSINFKLTLPIKSAQYLTWIKDRFSNDDAKMSYKNEVLICSFQSNTGLEVIPE